MLRIGTIRYDDMSADDPLLGHSGTINYGETLTNTIDVKWLWRFTGFLNRDSETLLPKVKQSRVGLKPMVLTYYGIWRITKTENTWDTRTPISRARHHEFGFAVLDLMQSEQDVPWFHQHGTGNAMHNQEISYFWLHEIWNPPIKNVHDILRHFVLQASARPTVVNMKILPQGITRMITNVDDDTGLQ